MKRPCFLFFLLFLLACSAGRRTATDAQPQLSGGWELTLFPAGDKQFAELLGPRRPQLQFNMADKKVSGTTGCNRFAGSFAVEGPALRFSENMALTKMACPNYDENNFLNAMASVNRFHLRNDQLDLLQDSTLLMTFTRMK